MAASERGRRFPEGLSGAFTHLAISYEETIALIGGASASTIPATNGEAFTVVVATSRLELARFGNR
jgi:hypothetical protein